MVRKQALEAEHDEAGQKNQEPEALLGGEFHLDQVEPDRDASAENGGEDGHGEDAFEAGHNGILPAGAPERAFVYPTSRRSH